MLFKEPSTERGTDRFRSDARTLHGECHVQQFRFLPDSYFRAIGSELDTGTERLVYLRLFIEEETEDQF